VKYGMKTKSQSCKRMFSFEISTKYCMHQWKWCLFSLLSKFLKFGALDLHWMCKQLRVC